MKKDKQIVLDRIKDQDKSKLHFVDTDYWDHIEEYQGDVERDVRLLKSISSVEDRICEILRMCSEYASFDENNRHQCRSGANRSALDIWRLYNNYFRPISIFYIMRALYRIVAGRIGNYEIGTLFCHDIHKQVFTWDDNSLEDVFYLNELGVRFAEWRTIGLG